MTKELVGSELPTSGSASAVEGEALRDLVPALRVTHSCLGRSPREHHAAARCVPFNFLVHVPALPSASDCSLQPGSVATILKNQTW